MRSTIRWRQEYVRPKVDQALKQRRLRTKGPTVSSRICSLDPTEGTVLNLLRRSRDSQEVSFLVWFAHE